MTALQVPLSLPLGDVRGNKTLHLAMPRTRGECVGAQRPCPHVQCRHHIVGDIMNQPRAEYVEAAIRAREESGCVETCALDVADRGPVEDEEIARIFGITRQRVQQVADEANRSANRLSVIRVKQNARELLQAVEQERQR